RLRREAHGLRWRREHDRLDRRARGVRRGHREARRAPARRAAWRPGGERVHLVKLGGSVITDKATYRAPRLEDLSRLAQELRAAPGPLVVVHGAGSYGHVLAKEFRLAEGRDRDARRDAAFAQVHADVRELSVLVSEALRDAGLPAITHAPVADMLAAGFVPVLSGDGALDASRGWGILSGDVIMAELARALRPERA